MTSKYNFIVEVDREHSQELWQLFKEKGVCGGEIIRKAVDFPDL